MSDQNIKYNNEIDLVDLLETIYNGRIKIIITSIIAVLFGFSISFFSEKLFEIRTPLNIKSSALIDFMPINDILKENNLDFTDENLDGYVIDANSIFNLFENEFNDYEELGEALLDDLFVIELLKGLNEIEKKNELIKLSKRFQIIHSEDGENKFFLFKWHDVLEGSLILEKAIDSILINILETIRNDLNKLAISVELRNNRNLASLQNKMNMILLQQAEISKKRIHFLTEQSEIARELGIDSNILDINALSQTTVFTESDMDNDSSLQLNINTGDSQFYLRGYQAIEKEISLIKNRSEEEQLLSSQDYIKITNEILQIENDLSASQLRDSLEIIENYDNSWLLYDLTLADSKSLSNTIVYILVSLSLGVIFAMVYLLVSATIFKQKKLKGNN